MAAWFAVWMSGDGDVKTKEITYWKLAKRKNWIKREIRSCWKEGEADG